MAKGKGGYPKNVGGKSKPQIGDHRLVPTKVVGIYPSNTGK